MRVHYLQHVPFEGPGAIAAWAREHGHHLAGSRLYAGDPLPGVDDFDRLVVMGGPMNVHRTAHDPWLEAERERVREAIDAGRSVVGVCLGAQIIAAALGARVFRQPEREIGWFPVETTEAARRTPMADALPARFTALHWHGDTFELPAGAVHLARSHACAHQAFLFEGRVLGLQFHLEMTRKGLERLVDHCGDEIDGTRYVQPAGEMLAASEARYREIRTLLFDLLDRLPE